MARQKKPARERYEDTKKYLQAHPGTSIKDACKVTKMNPNYFSSLQSKEKKQDEARAILRGEAVHAPLVPHVEGVPFSMGNLPTNQPVVMLVMSQEAAAQMLKGFFR